MIAVFAGWRITSLDLRFGLQDVESMLCHERVICLNKIKYGEADLILKFITSHGEVYSAIAKSALRSKKRFGGGVLEPTHYMQITLHKRTVNMDDERLSILNEAKLIHDFPRLKTDYDRLQTGLHFVKLVSTVAREGDLHKDIFNLLGQALKAAENSEDLGLLKTQFDVKFLRLQGILPHEDRYMPFLRTPLHQHARLSELIKENHVEQPIAAIQRLLDGYVL